MRETGRCLEFPFSETGSFCWVKGINASFRLWSCRPTASEGWLMWFLPTLGPLRLACLPGLSCPVSPQYRHSHRQVCSPNSCFEEEEVWMLNNGAVIGNWFVHLPAVWVKVSRWCLASYLPSTITSFFSLLPLSLHSLPQHLQQHENAVEGDACYYHCVLCNYSTKAKLNLIQHVRSMKHQRSESLRKLQRLQKGLPEEEEDLSSIFTIRKCSTSDTGQSMMWFFICVWPFFLLILSLKHVMALVCVLLKVLQASAVKICILNFHFYFYMDFLIRLISSSINHICL